MLAQEVIPEAGPDVGFKVSLKVNPETGLKVDPQAVTEAVPETGPEAVPEIVPAAALEEAGTVPKADSKRGVSREKASPFLLRDIIC
jgi:hypothetical protein